MNISIDYSENEVKFILDGEQIGYLSYTCGYFEVIMHEYEETLSDEFDFDIMRGFDPDERVTNIEYFYINKEYRGIGLGKTLFGMGLKEIENREHCKQFILRAYPDKGTEMAKLIEIYESFGFVAVQETEEDGIIMTKTK